MKNEKNIAIVGGGPAGAYLGYLLAKEGLKPVIFDDSHPREKPCGGGLTSLCLERFPFLQELPIEKNVEYNIELISPNNEKIMIKDERPSWTISREEFDKTLLDMAVNSGAVIIKEHVKQVRKSKNVWEIITKEQVLNADVIIGADGVNSIVRKYTSGRFNKEDIGVCYGCYATSNNKEHTRITFFDDINGYGWCFPRKNHLCIGVGVSHVDRKQVKNLFNTFIETYYPDVSIIEYWGAKIPHISNPKFYTQACCGDNWMILGDAAGHVNTLNGEGITFALWGAEMASQAILSDNIKSYDELWRVEYGAHLINGTMMQGMFYHPFILNTSVSMAQKSSSLAKILSDSMNSMQPNDDFMQRMIRDSFRILKEYFFSIINNSADGKKI